MTPLPPVEKGSVLHGGSRNIGGPLGKYGSGYKGQAAGSGRDRLAGSQLACTRVAHAEIQRIKESTWELYR